MSQLFSGKDTSDTFAVFLSEVPVFFGVPPTLLPCFCRRWAQSKPCEPLGRARASCFEWSALVSADRGAVDGGFLSLPGTEICQIVYAVVGEYAGRPLYSLCRTIAGHNQSRRFKAASANKTQRVRAGCFVLSSP